MKWLTGLLKRGTPREDSIDERVAKALEQDFRKLPPELHTSPADVSGTAIGGAIDELPHKLVDAAEAAIWEHNKLLNLLCVTLPESNERYFALHLSLNRDGSWHVEQGEMCGNPFDSNYSFYISPKMSRESCRKAARQALDACVSYLKAHE